MSSVMNKFFSLFHQDILSVNPDLSSALKEAVSGLSESDKVELRTELETIAYGTGKRFFKVWNESRSPFRLNEHAADRVLVEMLKVL